MINPKLASALGLSVVASCLATAPAIAEMTVNFGGRIQVDYTYYDDDNIDLSSGSEFRRARFFAEGDIADDWSYKAQYDFAGNGTELKDVYIRYGGWDFGKLTIGQFKHEFGLEVLTSSKYMTFVERASLSAFAVDRRIGIGLAGDAGRWHWAASVFGEEESADVGGDEGYGVAGRVTWAPQFGDNSFIHLGAAANWQIPAESNDLGPGEGNYGWRVRSRPETHQTNVRLVDTGVLGNVDDSDGIVTYGLEGAWVAGPLSIQGEWAQQTVNRDDGDEPDFSSWYVYGSWFITGESRSYKGGSFGRTKATNAWEIAARYSTMDLEDGDIGGGEQDIITLGVNYYVNPYLRFMFNYVRTDADNASDRFLDDNGNRIQDEPNAFVVRAAMDFK
jgi:phosphate-selective porin OprO/OprP